MRTARIAIALLMLFANTADAARCLVVSNHGGGANGKAITTILNLINPGGYDVMSPCSPEINTERLRTGVLPSGTYGAIIYAALGETDCGVISLQDYYRLDSLRSTAMSPTVPHLWVGNQGTFSRGSGWDSLGIGSPDLTTQPGGLTYRLPGTSYTFATNMSEGATVTPDEIPPGGIRKYISRTVNARGRYNVGGLPCVDCDSSNTIAASATTDSVLMWSKLNSHKAGAKPIICVIPSDFAGADVEYSPEVIFMALAALDSVSGHAVFGENPRPIQWGFVVRGAFSRMTHASSGGFPPQDTATVYASIDSLASLRVPFSVAANVCSVATYPRDKQVWARASMAHYTPYITNGAIDSAAAGNQGASYNVPVDPFGRWRSRAAYGDGSRAGKDTSITALLVAARFKADSLWPGRVDHLLIAPWDDWSPINAPTMTLDSLFGAFRKAGFVGVLANQRLRNSNPTAVAGANPYGWWPAQRWEYTRMINAGRFKVLASPGWQDSGSARFDNGSGGAGSYVFPTFDRIEMFWRGLLMGATMPGRSSTQFHAKRPDSTDGATRIYSIHVGDLGKGVHASGRATRPGWWQIKYIVNASRAINYLAGRTLIDIRYPEDVDP